MEENVLPTLNTSGSWQELLQPEQRTALEAILPAYIHPRRWFGAKAQQIVSAQITDTIAIPLDADALAYLTLVRLNYAAGGSDTYVLPFAYASAEQVAQLAVPSHALIARLASEQGDGILFDALFAPAFCTALLDLIADGRSLVGEHGTLQASHTAAFARLRGTADTALPPKVGTAEQSNTSVIFGGRLIMKVFRKFEPGINPDLEIGRFLTDHSDFQHVPPAAGTIEYRDSKGEVAGLAFLQGFVANEGDAWSYTLRAIAESFTRVLTTQQVAPDDHALPAALLDLAKAEPPSAVRDVINGYLDAAALLGRRTAELHLALAGDARDADFSLEPFDASYRDTVSASIQGRAGRSFDILRTRVDALHEPLRSAAQQILGRDAGILTSLSDALAHPIAAERTRVHGDYHLGQVLAADDDFFIIDFEGEPARPLRERRIKSSPLQDVAGMLRSFHYAPYAVLLGQAPGVSFDADQRRSLDPWARLWYRWVSATFLKSYLATAGQAPFIPQSRGELRTLLDLYLLDKALYELAYELNNRPDWVRIPLEGVTQLVDV